MIAFGDVNEGREHAHWIWEVNESGERVEERKLYWAIAIEQLLRRT
jgi:hypothetical protein